MAQSKTTSSDEYKALDKAFRHFNKALFNSTLPDVMFTLNRRKYMGGYFWHQIFSKRGGKERRHEIALNPDYFKGQTDRDIMSTLVHEMCHLWQSEFGTRPSKNYHNRQFTARMLEIGLQTSMSGKPGGDEIGRGMSHYIIDGGRFDKAFQVLARRGFKLTWESGYPKPRGKIDSSKVKFSCPSCGLNAWAIARAKLVCGVCSKPQTLRKMIKTIVSV